MNRKDCLHQHLQMQVQVDYQAQNLAVVIVLLTCIIKNVYHEHLLKVKTV